MARMQREHSPAGYLHSESLSAIQKTIRRNKRENALFWGGQVMAGGYANHLMQHTLCTIAVEDVGMGWPQAAQFVQDKLEAFLKPSKGKKGVPVSKAFTHEVMATLVLQTIAALASAPKCRMADELAWAQLDVKIQVQDIKARDRDEEEDDLLTYDLEGNYADRLVLCLERELVSQHCDVAVLEQLTLLLWLLIEQLNKSSSQYLESRVWECLVAVANRQPRRRSTLGRAVEALQTMANKRRGNDHLCFLQAVLLCCLHPHVNWWYKPQDHNQEVQEMLQFLTNPKPLLTRKYEVPRIALDLHTQRGRGTSTKGRLRPFVEMHLPDDQKYEDLKLNETLSHGDGLKPGKEGLRAAFWRESVVLTTPFFAVDSDMGKLAESWRQRALAVASQQEKEHGLRGSEGRSIRARIWDSIREAVVEKWAIPAKDFEGDKRGVKKKRKSKTKTQQDADTDADEDLEMEPERESERKVEKPKRRPSTNSKSKTKKDEAEGTATDIVEMETETLEKPKRTVAITHHPHLHPMTCVIHERKDGQVRCSICDSEGPPLDWHPEQSRILWWQCTLETCTHQRCDACYTNASTSTSTASTDAKSKSESNSKSPAPSTLPLPSSQGVGLGLGLVAMAASHAAPLPASSTADVRLSALAQTMSLASPLPNGISRELIFGGPGRQPCGVCKLHLPIAKLVQGKCANCDDPPALEPARASADAARDVAAIQPAAPSTPAPARALRPHSPELPLSARFRAPPPAVVARKRILDLTGEDFSRKRAKVEDAVKHG